MTSGRILGIKMDFAASVLLRNIYAHPRTRYFYQFSDGAGVLSSQFAEKSAQY